MYIGGGAVDYEQSYLLGCLVVVCKSWKWAALVYAAARVAGLASNNSLGPLNSALVISMDGEEGDLLVKTRSEFKGLSESVWQRTRACWTEKLNDPGREKPQQASERSVQSATVGLQLDKSKSEHAASVKALLGESG